MKVIHLGIGVVPVPPGDIAAGREEYIYQLTKHLGYLGCQVHVIDVKGGAQQRQKRQQSPAKFHTVWRPPLPYKWNLLFLQSFYDYIMYPIDTLRFFLFALLCIFPLNRLLDKEKIEIIHSHQRDTALVAVIVNKLRRNPAIVLYTPQIVPSGLPKWLRNIVHFAEILALRWVDHIVSLTMVFKDWLVCEYKLEPGKITPIPVGTAKAEIEWFLSQKKVGCHQSNMVLCTGTICQRKNQLTAVKAISKVIAAHPEVKLVFTGKIGEVSYFDSIQRFIAENNLSRWVEFKGEVTKQELYEHYSEANIFLFPSTAEVQPTVVMEALAFGLPMVASNIGANTDVVGGGGCAVLVDPYDVDGIATAIRRLLEDSSLRQEMSERAKKLAETMSYENVAKQTLALYNRLVQDKKPDCHTLTSISGP